MIFTDPRLGPHRAGGIAAQLDPSDGWVRHNAIVSLTGDLVTLDAAKGVLWWRDLDGEQRHLLLPSGITTEAVVGLLGGLRIALTPWPVRPGHQPVLAGWPDPDARPTY
jgi:hypothetical protein